MYRLKKSQTILLSREETIEIVPDRLYWVCSNKDVVPKKDVYVLDFDDVYEYIGFNYDFGPVDISQVVQYCQELYYTLRSPTFKDHVIIQKCSQQYDKKANSAFLICAYCVLILEQPAEKVWEKFSTRLQQKIIPFRDSLNQIYSTFECTILDCLRGIEEARKLGWLNYKKFDHVKYDQLANILHGDLSEIVPEKIYAFRGPRQKREEGVRVATAEDFLPVFRELGITKVIQLNEANYDANIFKSRGVDHVKIIFPDCCVPSEEQVKMFLNEVQSCTGKVAVHCQAGLGRTGTMIAMYCMKKHYFPAKPLISYLRMVRPGSIHGPQHLYIYQKETEFIPFETTKPSVKYNPGMTVKELYRCHQSDLDQDLDFGDDSIEF